MSIFHPSLDNSLCTKNQNAAIVRHLFDNKRPLYAFDTTSLSQFLEYGCVYWIAIGLDWAGYTERLRL
jgi:hypothetical protein